MPEQQQQAITEIFYDYALPPVVVAGNAALTTQIVINQDADFMAFWLISNSSGGFNCRFGDAGRGWYFMSGLIANVNLFGTALLPFPMLPPYTFKAQGAITIDLVDTSGAPNTIQIVFSGKKIFKTAQP